MIRRLLTAYLATQSLQNYLVDAHSNSTGDVHIINVDDFPKGELNATAWSIIVRLHPVNALHTFPDIDSICCSTLIRLPSLLTLLVLF